MKKLCTLLVLLIAMQASNAQTSEETLTNEKIIQLSKIGLQPSVIVNKIKGSKTNFDVSTDALITLNSAGVAAEVINAMMKTSGEQNAAETDLIDSKDPNAMHRSGIYIFNSANIENPLSKIEVVRVSSYQSSSGGYYGVGGSSKKAVLSGFESKQQLTTSTPVFYFYFNPKENVKADWYENAASPNEFALVKVIDVPKKNIRLFKVGGSSTVGFSSSSHSGIPEALKIPFEFTLQKDGIYKVTFKEPLEEGEYCFVYAAATGKVFDFGIHSKGKRKK